LQLPCGKNKGKYGDLLRCGREVGSRRQVHGFWGRGGFSQNRTVLRRAVFMAEPKKAIYFEKLLGLNTIN